MSHPSLRLRAVCSFPRSPHCTPFRPLHGRAPEWQVPVCGGGASLGRLSALCRLGLSTLQSVSGATTVMVTNDWASAKVQVVSPKPPAISPPGYAWSEQHEGEAVANLNLRQVGLDPIYGEQFIGSAKAKIGPTLDLGDVSTPSGATILFGSFLLADDTRGCEAQATLESIWRVTVTGDSIPFYAAGFVEFGHSMDFTLQNFTTGQEVFSTAISGMGGLNNTGVLEQSHEYLLTLRQRAMFGEGDGTVQFEFGFNAPVQIDFSSGRTHLPIPEPSSLSLLCFGAALLVRRRR